MLKLVLYGAILTVAIADPPPPLPAGVSTEQCPDYPFCKDQKVSVVFYGTTEAKANASEDTSLIDLVPRNITAPPVGDGEEGQSHSNNTISFFIGSSAPISTGDLLPSTTGNFFSTGTEEEDEEEEDEYEYDHREEEEPPVITVPGYPAGVSPQQCPNYPFCTNAPIFKTAGFPSRPSAYTAVRPVYRGNAAIRPVISGNAAVRPAFTGNIAVQPVERPVSSGSIAVRPANIGNTAVRPSFTGNIAVQPVVRPVSSGSIAVRPANIGNTAVRPSFTGNIAVPPAITGNTAVRPVFTGNIPVQPTVRPVSGGNIAVQPAITGNAAVWPPVTYSRRPQVSYITQVPQNPWIGAYSMLGKIIRPFLGNPIRSGGPYGRPAYRLTHPASTSPARCPNYPFCAASHVPVTYYGGIRGNSLQGEFAQGNFQGQVGSYGTIPGQGASSPSGGPTLGYTAPAAQTKGSLLFSTSGAKAAAVGSYYSSLHESQSKHPADVNPSTCPNYPFC